MLTFIHQFDILFWLLILLLINLIFPLIIINRPKIKNIGVIVLISILLFALINLVIYHSYHLAVKLTLFKLNNFSIEFFLEPLGLLFALLVCFLWLLNTLYAIGYFNIIKNYQLNDSLDNFINFTALAVVLTILISLAGNLFTIFICYELLSLSTYLLVKLNKDQASIEASKKYLFYLIIPSLALFLPTIIYTDQLAIKPSFSIGGVLGDQIQDYQLIILCLGYLYGVTKLALFPLHAWLPAAMVAPTPVSALLHAVVVVKSGLFIIIKVAIYIIGISNLNRIAPLIFVISSVTILLASIQAIKQDKLKSLLAYSTISQLAYSVLIISIASPKAIVAAIFHLLAHAIAKIGLFFSVGVIFLTSHTTKISELNKFSCSTLIKISFTVSSLSLIGIPPTIGFIDKFNFLTALTNLNYLDVAVLIVLIISTILTASYLLPVIYCLWWQKTEQVNLIIHRNINTIVIIPIIIVSLTTGLMTIYSYEMINFIQTIFQSR